MLSFLGAGFGLAAAFWGAGFGATFFAGIAIVPLIGASFFLAAPPPKMDNVARWGAGLGAGTD